ncbi:MAG: ester cyclase [Polyangiaceae bacterium]|nr:ester cyclase [Polyangiaceae bacterium]
MTTTLAFGALAACGGEQPPPASPPPPAPPPVATAAASPATAAPAPSAPPPAPKPSLAELIPQTLQGIGAAFNAHDSKKLASFFTEDATVADYGAGAPSHGRDEAAHAVQSIFDTFSEARLAPTRVWIKGNVAVMEVAWTGTMTGDMLGIKASKKPVGQYRVHIDWFSDDGLIKEEHQYADVTGLVAQMSAKKNAPPVPTLTTNAPEVHYAKGSPDDDKIADWAKTIDDTMSKDDAKAASELYAAEAELSANTPFANASGPAVKGSKDIAKTLATWFRAFPDQKWTVANAWGIDGFAIVEDSLTGTQKGALGTLPPSNKPVSGWHFVEIAQPTADGKVQHLWSYGNLAEATTQISPPKAPTVEKPVARGGAAEAPEKKSGN